MAQLPWKTTKMSPSISVFFSPSPKKKLTHWYTKSLSSHAWANRQTFFLFHKFHFMMLYFFSWAWWVWKEEKKERTSNENICSFLFLLHFATADFWASCRKVFYFKALKNFSKLSLRWKLNEQCLIANKVKSGQLVFWKNNFLSILQKFWAF